MRSLILTLIAGPVAAAPLPVTDIKRDGPVDFAREVFPALKRNCLACHNTTKAKAGLVLESPQLIAKGGDNGPGAIAGKGAESLIFRFSAHMDDEAMPPPDNKVNAVNHTPDELGLLRRWIDEGMKGTAPAATSVVVWREFPNSTPAVNAAALSPDGTVAAAARGNRVSLFDVPGGEDLGFLTDPDLAKLELYRNQSAASRDAVMAVAFGTSDLLATGGYRTTRLWRRGPLIVQKESATLADPALCAAAAGNVAAAGDAAGRVWLWDPAAEKPTAIELKDHASPVKALAVSPDALFIVSAAEDRSVSVWSAVTKSVIFRAESPVPLAALHFLKDGTLLAAAGNDGVLRIYPFPKEAPAAPPVPTGEFRLTDKAPAFLTPVDPSGTQIVWGSGDAVLHVFEAAAGKPVRDLTLEHPAAKSAAAAERREQSAGRHAEARKARVAAATDAANRENEAVKSAHETMERTRAAWQRSLAAARLAADALRAAPADGPRKEAATKSTGEAAAAERAFLNARTNAELSVRMAGQAQQNRVAAEAAQFAALSALTEARADLEAAKKATASPFPAVKSAVVLSGSKVILLATDTARAQWHSLENGALSDSAEFPASPILTPAGTQLLAFLPDKKSVLLPLRRPWQLERTIGTPDDPSILADRVTALSFSSDARLLATGGGTPSRGGEVKIWNTADGTLATSLKDPHSDTVNALAFSPEDSLLATAGSDRWARVFRVADGQRTAAFEGHSGHVLSVAWRHDGLALATGGADKSLRVWDLLDAKQARNNTSFGKEVSAVTWIGAGDVVASASGDATVRLNDDRLPGTKGFLFCLAADLSGNLLAAGGEDGVLRIWNATERKLLREYGAAPAASVTK